MSAFDHGNEWPCEDCSDAGMTPGYFDRNSGAAEPPVGECRARACSVDVITLRELEAQIELAAGYLAGVLTIHGAGPWYHVDLIEVLSDAIAEALYDEHESARVSLGSIKQRVTQLAQEHRTEKLAVAS